MKKKTDEKSKYIISHLECVPDIPDERKFWGKEYTSKCVCGGTLTAIRSPYNGHLFCNCNKCGFRMME